MDIKSIDRIATKFVTRASVAGPDYEAGATQPRRSWAQAAAAAEGNYSAGISAAVTEKRFSRGITKAGDAKFARGIREKGVARFPAGVAAAQGDYSAGFAPFHQALAGAALPPRKASRDPSNLERVRTVVNTMIATAKGQGK